MDAWVTQMTEEMGKLAMTLERVTTLENSFAEISTTTANLDERMGVLFGEIRTTTANLDERMAVLPGEIRTTTATRVEFEELKQQAGVPCHKQMLHEHVARNTFQEIFKALHSIQEWAYQAETTNQPLLS